MRMLPGSGLPDQPTNPINLIYPLWREACHAVQWADGGRSRHVSDSSRSTTTWVALHRLLSWWSEVRAKFNVLGQQAAEHATWFFTVLMIVVGELTKQ